MPRSTSVLQGRGKMKGSRLYRFGGALARHHWPVIVCWAILLGGAGFLLPNFVGNLTGPTLKVGGSGSDREQRLVQDSFVHPFSEEDLLVFDSTSLTVRDARYRQVITNAIQAVSRDSRVAGVLGPLEPLAPAQVSADGHAAIAIVGVSGTPKALQALAPVLTKAATGAATSDVHVYLTGTSPLIAGLANQQSTDLVRAERYGLPIALVVLILAFGALVAAGVPLLIAVVAIALAWGVLGAVTYQMSFDLFVENITTMIGLGVGIDYSLLIVTRYREELADHDDPITAIATAISTSGKAVLFSGTAVLLSLASLLIVNAQIFHDLAIGGMTSVAVAMATDILLLPAVLGALGHRINRFDIPLLPSGVQRTDSDTGFWADWAGLVMRFALPCVILAVAVLLAIAYPILQIRLGLDTGVNSLGNTSVGEGLNVLAKDFAPGVVAPIAITIRSPNGTLTLQDLAAVARLSSDLESNQAVAQVESLPTVAAQLAGSRDPVAILAAITHPGEALTLLHFLLNYQRGGDVTVVAVVPRGLPTSHATEDLVRQIRGSVAPRDTQGTHLQVLVGGLPAQIVDISAETETKLPVVIGVIVLITFAFLAMVFRSIFLPFKAILMNILSIGASFGALVLVFQKGYGSAVFSFQTPGSIQLYLPLLTFAVLFGLSMDYEVFLVGRMREEWERTGNNDRAVKRGLQYTARVIASAAAIEVAVFGSFVFSNTIEIKELGFSLAVAIFVDATIVRLILVPALMRLVRRANWWFPSWLDRILPRIELGEEAGGRSKEREAAIKKANVRR